MSKNQRPIINKEWDEAFELVYQRGIAAGMKQAAEIANAFEEENFSMCYDSILFDPVMSKCARGDRQQLTLEDINKSEAMQIDGTIHSSMAHAAQNIAKAIREKIKEGGK
ncbi:hypothetical protein [Agrobacterium cavarae]|uniref:hypothetical protein n=1 Tax=Agrobacterium cavarae TaxID=2528239 RepID=UPI003FD5CEC5